MVSLASTAKKLTQQKLELGKIRRSSEKEFKKAKAISRKYSSSLTSLQKSAELEQKWPLLNLVRQVLKSCNYLMKPIRQSAGYDKEGKKKYRRLFRIDKMKPMVTEM